MYAKQSWRLLVGESSILDDKSSQGNPMEIGALYRVLRRLGNEVCEV